MQRGDHVMAKHEHLTGLNPEILVWARRTAGRKLDEVASRLSKEPETILAWEAGDEETGDGGPTYPQLEKLADLYKRPVALFFFPQPPDEEEPEHAFRTLPEFELADLAADTRFKIRDGLAKQMTLRDLTGGLNPAKRRVFVDLEATTQVTPAGLAAKARAYFGVGVEDQRSWKTMAEGLRQWRDVVENFGVFVFKDSFSQREVSGFCLQDDVFPIIYLNNSVAKSRQIFTLFHELAHLLLGTNGMTKRDMSYISKLRGTEKRIEVFCNAFAGEFLAPKEALATLTTRQSPPSDKEIADVAKNLKVSRTVILRRLLDLDCISRGHYRVKAAEVEDEYLDAKPKSAGGSYYNSQAAYLGQRFLELAFQQFYRGAISRFELADSLGVRHGNIGGLEQRVLAGTG